FPVEEQSGICLSDVVTRPDPDTACSLINPARRALDLAKVPDGRFIHHDVALSVSPLPTEFLIAKRRRVTQGAQDSFHPRPVGNFGFHLHPCFVTSRLPLPLAGHHPLASILT